MNMIGNNQDRVVKEYNLYYNSTPVGGSPCLIKFKEQFGYIVFQESYIQKLRVRPKHEIYELTLKIFDNVNTDARRSFLAKRLSVDDTVDVDTFIFHGEADNDSHYNRLAVGIEFQGDLHIAPISKPVIVFEFHYAYLESDKNCTINIQNLQRKTAINNRIKLSYSHRLAEMTSDPWQELEWKMLELQDASEMEMNLLCPEEAMQRTVLSSSSSLFSNSGPSKSSEDGLLPSSTTTNTNKNAETVAQEFCNYVCLASRALADKVHRDEEQRVYGVQVSYCLHSQKKTIEQMQQKDKQVDVSQTNADGKMKQMKVSRYELPFLSQLPFMPLLERLQALLLQAHVMKFETIMNILKEKGYNNSTLADSLPSDSGTGAAGHEHRRIRFNSGSHAASADAAVLKVLQEIAVLVQGCWVIKSSLVFVENETNGPTFIPVERLQLARDFVLWNFSVGRCLTRKEVICAVKLPALVVTRILNQCAQRRINQDNSRVNRWEFKCSDPKFVKRHQSIVDQENRSWEVEVKRICLKLNIERPTIKHEEKNLTRRRVRTCSRSRSCSESSEVAEEATNPAGGKPESKRRRTMSSCGGSGTAPRDHLQQTFQKPLLSPPPLCSLPVKEECMSPP